MTEMFPGVEMVVNEEKPRRQSFNLTLDGKLLWDGHKMGPPRALKFDVLLDDTLHALVMGKKK